MIRLLFLLAWASYVEAEVEKQSMVHWTQGPIPLDPDAIRAHRDVLAVRLRTDPDPAERMKIAAALAFEAHDQLSIPTLAVALRAEPDPDVQVRLVAALLSFREPEAVEAVVVSWLQGPPPEIEPIVARALAGASPRLVQAALEEHAHLSPERAARPTLAPR